MASDIFLHLVDPVSRVRAELARLAFDMDYHCEVYADLDELVRFLPREGIIMMRDGPAQGGVAQALEALAEKGVWLPLIAHDDDPVTTRVVAAMKAGALDYLRLPIDEATLRATLERSAGEAGEYRQSRRRMVEARHRIAGLSQREREVLDRLAQGNSNKAIARDLEISPRTVEIHRANMMHKLGASHSAEAVRLRIEAQI